MDTTQTTTQDPNVPSGLDPTAFYLTKAIRQTETGGTSNAYAIPGASGEFGAYQYTEPTWDADAQKYLGQKVPLKSATPQQQNQVAYSKIADLLKQNNGSQTAVASIWNSGKSDPNAAGTGTNSYGVKYDVPGYVNSVKNNYLSYANKTQAPSIATPTPDQNPSHTIDTTATPDQTQQPAQPQTFGQKALDFIGTLTGTKEAGEDIAAAGDGQNMKNYTEALQSFSDVSDAIAQKIQVDKAQGKDTIRLQGALKQHMDSMPKESDFIPGAVNKTAEQIFGDFGQLALGLTSGGGLESGGEAIANRELSIGQKIVQGAKIGTGYGAAAGLTSGMSNNEDAGKLAGSTAFGAGIGLATGGLTEALIGGTVRGVQFLSNAKKEIMDGAISDWNRIGGDYVKTNKLLDTEGKVGKDTPTFLVTHGIGPKQLIENGKFDTTEVANKLTGEAVQPFEDILTKQLKVVDQGQPPVDIGKIHSDVVDKINKTPNLTVGDKDTMIRSATREMRLLQKRYPKGIPLADLNVEKGNYWRNTKFDLSRPLQSQVNYSIGNVMKNTIEKNAPDVNVKEMNNLLGDYYAAGKFLRGIDGKTAKLSAGEKLQRTVVKGLGIASGLDKFGLKGGVGGYLLGQSVANLLEQSSGSLQGFILKRLESEDPAVYKEAIQWLGSKESERLSRLMLPAGAEVGNEKNPIITPNTKGTPNPAFKTTPTVETKTIPNKQGGFANKAALATGAGVATAAIGASQLKSKQTVKNPTPTAETPKKTVVTKQPVLSSKKIADNLMAMESSSGRDKKYSKRGDAEWLVGMTPSARKDLKASGDKTAINLQSKKSVVDASVRYFKLLQKRFPKLTPAEVYVDHYWGGAKTPQERQAKIDSFNSYE